MENGYATAACPGPDELAEFATGNLSGDAFRRVARHVEGCAACETALSDFDGQTPPFLRQVRQAASEAARPAEPVPRELVSAARSLHVARPSPEEPPQARRLGKFA